MQHRFYMDFPDSMTKYFVLKVTYPGCWQVLSLARKETICACQKCDGQRNGLIWLGKRQVVDSCKCGNEPPSPIKCRECSMFPPWSG